MSSEPVTPFSSLLTCTTQMPEVAGVTTNCAIILKKEIFFSCYHIVKEDVIATPSNDNIYLPQQQFFLPSRSLTISSSISFISCVGS